jgi:hypothetical protein
MGCRIRFFRDGNQARETRQFLNTRGVKSYLRERTPSTVVPGEEPFGFDVFVLREDDIEEARLLLSYEFGSTWGETTSGR